MTVLCQFYDCGWCYAPANVLTNSPKGSGECRDIRSCPQSRDYDDAIYNEPVKLELKTEEN